MGCRDVFNEKPTADELVPVEDDGGAAAATLPRGAIIHTTRGDIWVRLFPDECPKVQFCGAISQAFTSRAAAYWWATSQRCPRCRLHGCGSSWV